MMRKLGFALALVCGLLLWGLTALLAGGVYPLGTADSHDKLLFLTPVVLFAAPLAALAAIRGMRLTAAWLIAVSPACGLLNGLAAVGLLFGQPHTSPATGQEPMFLAMLWLALTLAVLLIAFIGNRLRRADPAA